MNPTLARWLDDRAQPAVDCAGCARFGKCCDFQPFVPNVFVGAMLAAGHALPNSPNFVRQPLGLIPAAWFRRARDARRDRAASRDGELCAFFADGRCSIWAFRPAECSAYTCRGVDAEFSRAAFDFETALAQMALVEQGLGPGRIARQIDILNEPGDQLDHDDAAEHVYRRAWAWARNLSRAELASWLEDQ